MQSIRVQACDTCRKKKVRCKAEGDDCLQCIQNNTHCRFTPTTKRKTPRRPAGYKHVEALKIRLDKMEALLQASGKVAEVQGTTERPEGNLQNSFVVTGEPNTEYDTSSIQLEEQIFASAAAGDQIPVQTINSSSNLDSRLPKPSEFSERPPSTTKLSQLLLGPSQLSTQYWNGSPFSHVFPRGCFQKLPPMPVALTLVNDALESFNTFFPIFDAKSFMEKSREKYPDADPSKDSGWWACINILLAIAHRFRSMRISNVQDEDRHACSYIQNALAVVPDLLLSPSCLSTVQALLATTIILRGTPNSGLCPSLIGATIRAAQTMGLHKQSNELTVDNPEAEQQKLVFWIAYVVDKDISLRTGLPPAQDDDDIDVYLPSQTALELGEDQAQLKTLEILSFHIELAMIQGQTYKMLYSVKGVKKPEIDRLLAAQELASRLKVWKSGIPDDSELEFPREGLQSPIAPSHLHYIILHLTYINCLIAVYRPFLVDISGSDLQSHRLLKLPESTFLFESTHLYEARRTIAIFRMMPQGDYYCIWLVIQILFAAVTTLLYNVLLDSSNISVQSDLDLTEPFIQLLGFLLKETHSREIENMYRIFYDLNRRARDAVAQKNIEYFSLVTGVW